MGGGLDVECGCGDYDEQDDQQLLEEVAYDESRRKIETILDKLGVGEIENLAAELEERYKEDTVEEELPVVNEMYSIDKLADDIPF